MTTSDSDDDGDGDGDGDRSITVVRVSYVSCSYPPSFADSFVLSWLDVRACFCLR